MHRTDYADAFDDLELEQGDSSEEEQGGHSDAEDMESLDSLASSPRIAMETLSDPALDQVVATPTEPSLVEAGDALSNLTISAAKTEAGDAGAEGTKVMLML
jgi:hypothetical protein